MIALIGSLLTDTLIRLIVVAAVAGAGFLMWHSVHTVWLRRRWQRKRERTRRDFWGYE